jgi:hypothetical protein
MDNCTIAYVNQTFEGGACLMVEKAKPRKLSTSKGGLQHQNHVKMNIHILGDAMAM